jgi:hypothetical protein
MVNYSVKNAQITMFTLIIVVLLSACSEKKIQPIQTNQRDIAAVYSQKDTAEIYIQPYSVQGLEGEDFFAIQSKSEDKPLKRLLKNPIEVYFNNQQVTDSLNN